LLSFLALQCSLHLSRLIRVRDRFHLLAATLLEQLLYPNSILILLPPPRLHLSLMLRYFRNQSLVPQTPSLCLFHLPCPSLLRKLSLTLRLRHSLLFVPSLITLTN
jgi:hypothetical protein